MDSSSMSLASLPAPTIMPSRQSTGVRLHQPSTTPRDWNAAGARYSLPTSPRADDVGGVETAEHQVPVGVVEDPVLGDDERAAAVVTEAPAHRARGPLLPGALPRRHTSPHTPHPPS